MNHPLAGFFQPQHAEMIKKTSNHFNRKMALGMMVFGILILSTTSQFLLNFFPEFYSSYLIYSLFAMQLICILYILFLCKQYLFSLVNYREKRGHIGIESKMMEDSHKTKDQIQKVYELYFPIVQSFQLFNHQNTFDTEIKALDDEELLQQKLITLQDVIDQISSAIEMINFSLQQLQKNMDGLVQGINHNSANLEESNTGLGLIKTSVIDQYNHIKEIKEKIEQSIALMQNVMNEVASVRSIHSVLYEISNVASQEVKTVMETMRVINDSMVQITTVLKGVRAIADQTTVLSINASIEAARAGLKGKGFSVIAHEVRQLAHKSTESANHTMEIVSQIVSHIELQHKNLSLFSRSFKSIIDKLIELGSSIDILYESNLDQQRFNESLMTQLNLLNQHSLEITHAVEELHEGNMNQESSLTEISDRSVRINNSIRIFLQNVQLVQSSSNSTEKIIDGIRDNFKGILEYIEYHKPLSPILKEGQISN